MAKVGSPSVRVAPTPAASDLVEYDRACLVDLVEQVSLNLGLVYQPLHHFRIRPGEFFFGLVILAQWHCARCSKRFGVGECFHF